MHRPYSEEVEPLVARRTPKRQVSVVGSISNCRGTMNPDPFCGKQNGSCAAHPALSTGACRRIAPHMIAKRAGVGGAPIIDPACDPQPLGHVTTDKSSLGIGS